MAWEPDYITRAEAKAYIRLADTLDDTEIDVAISAASRAIDDHCSGGIRRQFGKVDTPTVRRYTPRWRQDRGCWVVHIDDLQTSVGMVVSIGGAVLVAYHLEPRNAAADGMPWTRLVVDSDEVNQPTGAADEVEITALWGWTAVPATVKQACRLQTSRFLSRRDSPFGITGSPEGGREMRLLARLDADVAVMLRRLVRQGMVR